MLRYDMYCYDMLCDPTHLGCALAMLGGAALCGAISRYDMMSGATQFGVSMRAYAECVPRHAAQCNDMI